MSGLSDTVFNQTGIRVSGIDRPTGITEVHHHLFHIKPRSRNFSFRTSAQYPHWAAKRKIICWHAGSGRLHNGTSDEVSRGSVPRFQSPWSASVFRYVYRKERRSTASLSRLYFHAICFGTGIGSYQFFTITGRCRRGEVLPTDNVLCSGSSSVKGEGFIYSLPPRCGNYRH